MIKHRDVILLGAYGYTGRLVAQCLKEMGIVFNIAGKDINKLDNLKNELGLESKTYVFDSHKPQSLPLNCQKNTMLLNCIGPFEEFSKTLVKYVTENGYFYLDICGELNFIKYSFENLHRNAAISKALLIHSCSFESFFTDLMAAKICNKKTKYNFINTFYSFEKAIPSPGTKLTMRLSNLHPILSYENSRFIEKRLGILPKIPFTINKEGYSAAYVPYPEIFFFANTYKTENAGSYYIIDKTKAQFFEEARKQNNNSVEKILLKHKKRQGFIPSKEHRAKHRFQITVHSQKTTGSNCLIQLSGKDPYGLTAAILAWSCKNILNLKNIFSGVQSPANVFTLDNFLNNSSIVDKFKLHCTVQKNIE